MKRNLPYVIGAIALILLVILLSPSRKTGHARLDERLTLRPRDKIPYGTEAARRLLPEIFPAADIYYDRRHPGIWDSIRTTSYDQAVILISKEFDADHYELERLMDFADNGNYVFIIAKTFSGDARRLFRFRYGYDDFDYESSGDSLSLQLEPNSFSESGRFTYPGRRYESWFTVLDTPFTRVLGRDEYNRPNFIAFKKGAGAVYIHCSPVAFSNYFVLHRDNHKYFSKVLSVIPKNISSVLWNDYYLDKPIQGDDRRSWYSWLKVFFRYDAFKWGLLTAIFTMILYVLLGSRRRQRMIPVHSRPKNDSLDFVKTMGRLYYDRKDHPDLARKMSVYYLEHVRSVYKLPTHTLDESFIQALHFKTGYPLHDIAGIVSFINRLDHTDQVTEEQLSGFHSQLELFYQNT